METHTTVLFALGLLLLAAAPSGAQSLAVYQSEATHARYQGIYQAPLREWLQSRHQEFQVIGDAEAADAQRLRAYPVILATANYVVPRAACAGLAEYVAQGGRLLWIDTPVLCEDPVLLTTLGLTANTDYTELRQGALRPAAPGHPAIASLEGRLAVASLTSNATQALAPDALTLATLEGKNAENETVQLPAITLTRRGQGLALFFNWLTFLNQAPGVRALLDDGLDLLIADYRLKTEPMVLLTGVHQVEVRQPAPVRAVAKLFCREAASAPVRGQVVLVGKGTAVEKARRTARAEWQRPVGAPAFAVLRVELPTARLADGDYQLRWQVSAAGAAALKGSTSVTLEGQRWAALKRAERQRYRLLKPLLAGTLGDYDAEPRTPDGRVDIPRLIEQITTAHMNMYDFLIWHQPTDWEDFQQFLPAARAKGIKVWVTLCPPSEQGDAFPWSEPYRLDFVRWADEIGKLSKRYDNLVALVIDDFWVGANMQLFTPGYVARVAETLRRHNPRLAFLPTLYWHNIGDAAWMEQFGPSIDGIVFPYALLESWDTLPEQLRGCRKFLGPDKFLFVNVYAAGSSGPPEPGPRSAEYLRQVLTLSREGSDGVRIYCLPKEKLLEDYRYAITAELYKQWTSR